MQHDVLAAIVRNDAIWCSDMALADRLAERGLPTAREDVAQLIASAEDVG